VRARIAWSIGLLLVVFGFQHRGAAAVVPSGFTETQIVSGLASPTAMAIAPDGRIFVCLQGGQLRVVKDGALLAQPFLTVSVNSSGERGLLGVAFDPDFANNQFVYVYYTATTPTIHNRISRFTASGDVAVAGSETIILELDNLSTATNHNGGALHFGLDGKLYAAVGDNANGANSQTLSNLLGKMLRLNSDGTIPSDNPFVAQTSGRNQAIWALGLRNPFTFAFQAGSGRMFINDVGQNTYEEINDGIEASNYGWPATEGPTTNPAYRAPLYSYTHGSGAFNGCAITGGAFYNPDVNQFPAEFSGKYFFADYCTGWINLFDPSTGSASTFASGISAPVDLQVGSDGSLYYLARGSGGVIVKISYTPGEPPAITQHPSDQTVTAGQSASFSVAATGAGPLSYQWHRDGASISGATSATYTLASASGADSGARFHAVVTNQFGSATSNAATLTVTGDAQPSATILLPLQGSRYTAGSVIAYSGTGSDPEDGVLPSSAFTWRVDFHHDDHVHPFMAPASGATAGSFAIPRTGETSANVWYRIVLTVTDSAGQSTTTTRDLHPLTVRVTLTAKSNVFQLTLDGQPVAEPHAFTAVVGMIRSIGAPNQTIGGTNYVFRSWSDLGAQTHDITVPPVNTTYTARYQRGK
jgi:glucose/arabinose dehydrogenase